MQEHVKQISNYIKILSAEYTDCNFEEFIFEDCEFDLEIACACEKLFRGFFAQNL